MKINTVTFSKKYNYAPFLNYDLGAEATLDEGETEQEAWSKLEAMGNQYHKDHHTISPEELERMMHDTPVQFYQSKQEVVTTPEQETKNIIASIEKCENETQLLEYKLVALKNVQTKGSYNLRKKQLNLQ